MNSDELRRILNDTSSRRISVDEAFSQIRDLPYMMLDHVKFDRHRAIRRGLPEVVYGEGKREEDIVSILLACREKKENVIVTRLDRETAARVMRAVSGADYDPLSRVLFCKNMTAKMKGKGAILILSAGTSDLPVAREAELCARYLGNRVNLVSDVGIAGIHRLLDVRDELRSARCVIVVAGMEGALPSFVASMTDKPVVAVPTSVGYGANMGGLTALFGMLCNCSGGVAVMNIDNGFGAAYFATMINRL